MAFEKLLRRFTEPKNAVEKQAESLERGSVLQDIRKGILGRIGTPIALLAAINCGFRTPAAEVHEQPGFKPEAGDIDLTTQTGVEHFFTHHNVEIQSDADTVNILVDGATLVDGQKIEIQPAQDVAVQMNTEFAWGQRDYSRVAETTTGELDAQMKESVCNGIDNALGVLAPYLDGEGHNLASDLSVYGVAYRSAEGAAEQNQALSERVATYATEYATKALHELGFAEPIVDITGIGEVGSEDDMVAHLEKTGYHFSSDRPESKRAAVTQLIRDLHDGKPVAAAVTEAYNATMKRGVVLKATMAMKGIDVVVPVGTPPGKVLTFNWNENIARVEEREPEEAPRPVYKELIIDPKDKAEVVEYGSADGAGNLRTVNIPRSEYSAANLSPDEPFLVTNTPVDVEGNDPKKLVVSESSIDPQEAVTDRDTLLDVAEFDRNPVRQEAVEPENAPTDMAEVATDSNDQPTVVSTDESRNLEPVADVADAVVTLPDDLVFEAPDDIAESPTETFVTPVGLEEITEKTIPKREEPKPQPIPREAVVVPTTASLLQTPEDLARRVIDKASKPVTKEPVIDNTSTTIYPKKSVQEVLGQLERKHERRPVQPEQSNRRIQVAVGVSSGLGSSTVRGYHFSGGIQKRQARQHHTGKR